ncbi:MAG TPA: ABC transporter permease [Nitrospiria bacterium]|nr:ABC transporter permease [Nitrospiria bacterium]
MTVQRFIQSHPRIIFSAGFIMLIGLAALAAPWLSPYPFDQQDTHSILQGPGPQHWMGTDRLGRDLFSRLLYGARMSMSVGIFTALFAVLFGTVYGAVSGYVGGRTDNLLMRLVDLVYALPDLLLIILITVTIGRGVLGIFLALSLVSWVTVARIIRGEVLKLREFSFVEAARAVGASHHRILFLHILPNTLGVLIVTLTFRIPAAILAESTLSFIGLGIAPPFASWGSMASEGWSAMKFYPHLILFPSLVLFLTMVAFNVLGDALRDALDPQRRSR